MADHKILIICGAQAEAEMVQNLLGNSFAWTSIPPEWSRIEGELKEDFIKVVVIAGGKQDMVYDCIRYAQETKSGVTIFVVSTRPWTLTMLLRQFPQVTFFNTSTIMKDAPGFSGFDLFVPKIQANL